MFLGSYVVSGFACKPIKKDRRTPIMQFITSRPRGECEFVRTDRTLGNILTAILSWSFAGTALALLLEAVFHAELSPAQIAGSFIDSFVYSTFVSALVGILVFVFTPRLIRLRLPLNW